MSRAAHRRAADRRSHGRAAELYGRISRLRPSAAPPSPYRRAVGAARRYAAACGLYSAPGEAPPDSHRAPGTKGHCGPDLRPGTGKPPP